MATLETQLTDLIGTVSDASGLDDQFKQAARELMHILPAELLFHYAAYTDQVGASGFVLTDRRELAVSLNGYPCRKVPFHTRQAITNSASLHYATTRTPAYYVHRGSGPEETRIYIKPNPPSNQGELLYAQLPTSVDADVDTSISGLPTEAQTALLAAVGVRQLSLQIGAKRSSLPSSFTLSAAAPSAPTRIVFDFDETIAAAAEAASTIAALPTLTGVTISFTAFDAAMTNEDVELAASELSKLQMTLQEWERETLSQWQLDSQRTLDQARLVLEAGIDDARRTDEMTKVAALQTMQQDIAQYGSDLQKYAVDVQSYGAQVQGEIGQQQAKIATTQAEIAALQAEREAMRALYAEQLQLLGATPNQPR